MKEMLITPINGENDDKSEESKSLENQLAKKRQEITRAEEREDETEVLRLEGELRELEDNKINEEMDKDTEKYREEYKHEKAKIYDSLHVDPFYNHMIENAREKTERGDNSLFSKKEKKTHEENFNDGLVDFVKRYPEKAQAYAERWNSFVEKHPEAVDMSEDQLDNAFRGNINIPLFMEGGQYRYIAKALERLQEEEKKETNKSQESIEDAKDSDQENLEKKEQREFEDQEKIEDLKSDIDDGFDEDLDKNTSDDREKAKEDLADIFGKDLVGTEDLLSQIDYYSGKANQSREDWPSAYHYTNGMYMKATGSEGYYPKFTERMVAYLALLTKSIVEKVYQSKLNKLVSQEEEGLDTVLDDIDRICQANDMSTLRVLFDKSNDFKKQIKKIEIEIQNTRVGYSDEEESKLLKKTLRALERKQRHFTELMMHRYGEFYKRGDLKK